MRMLIRLSFAFGLVISGATVCFAQAPLSLTLEEAIRRGVETAPRLIASRARESAATSEVAARNALRLPTVRTIAGYQRQNHVEEFGFVQPNGVTRIVFPDIPNNYLVRTEMTLAVLPISEAKAGVEAARAEARATSAETLTTTQDLRLQIAQTYWSLVTAREDVRVLDESLQRMDAWVGDIRARVDAGVLGPNDLLAAQAQRARQAVQRIQAQNAAVLAELDLDRQVGADPGQPLVLTTAVHDPIGGVEQFLQQSPADLITNALAHRPERQTLRERVASLHAAAVATSAQRLPQLATSASVEPARPNPRFAPRTDTWRATWDFGATLTWTLFDGGHIRATAAEATAQALALEHQMADFDALVAVEIRQRLQDVQAGRMAADAAATAVAAAAENRRVAQERFNAGVVTSTDVRDAQLALMESELDQTHLIAAVRLAEARLLRALGAS